MTPGLGLLIDIGVDILKTSKTNAATFITAQIGNVLTSIATGDVSEWWQHVGFASRPRAPQPGAGAAQAVVIKRSDHDAVIASRDSRSAAVYHSLADGETAIFASEGDAIIILRANGTIEVTGGTVKIGDSAAAALAKAAAISDLQTAINGWVPVPNDGGAALKAALVTWLANTTYSTTKAKGT
jgi:phage gp45-like